MLIFQNIRLLLLENQVQILSINYNLFLLNIDHLYTAEVHDNSYLNVS